MFSSDLLKRDHKHIFHPCTQMKDHLSFPPLIVTSAKGSYITLADGRKIIDATASWWCKSLGHRHPRLTKALQKQLARFEHVIFANTTHETIVSLSEKLAALTKTLDKVLYASEGSSAIEMAMKMSLHAHALMGEKERTQFIALENSYHGETVGALSVSDTSIYQNPYRALLFKTHFISKIPYVNGTSDSEWTDCENAWQTIEKTLIPLAPKTTALILEPILQGAGGMKIYSQHFLKRLREFTQAHHIHLIADEIMTGIGRTGKMLACEHAGIEPDFLCLSKGLTSGVLPLSVVLTSTAIYHLFYDDYESGKSFLHSHTHSGNALAASVANETLAIFKEEKICDHAILLGNRMRDYLQDIAQKTGRLTNVRHIGAMAAAEIVCDDPKRRVGYEISQKAIALGALLRVLDKTLYWLPPLNTAFNTLDTLKKITHEAIQSV